MILVDSGIWIDQLAARQTLQTLVLERMLMDEQDVGLGDLMLVEVLQGTRHRRDWEFAVEQLAPFTPVRICDHRIAVAAARNYRHLRSLGITPRKTIDTLIATRCIIDDIPLLYGDRDFDPFVEHFGLRSALDLPGVN